MKSKLAILVLLSSAPWADAATTVPTLMSYQGRVTDSAGVAIGSTAAVNRTVTFRLYSVSSGGTASYNETQTVTISGGEFSVLIGNGTGITNKPGPSSPAFPITSLDAVINTATTSALYLGITVDDGNASTVDDAEISPRQQLVTGPYSMRSIMAESVANGAVTSAMLFDSAVGTNQVAANAITSAKIADASIAAADIAGSTITAAKIDTTSIGLWAVSGNNIYRASNVGVGFTSPAVTSPAAVLEVWAKTGTTTPANNGLRVVNSANSTGNNAVLAAAVAGSSAGSPFVSLALDPTGTIGWSIGVDNVDLDKLVFKNSYDFAASPKMVIDTAGFVGIGTTSPGYKLDVSDGNVNIKNTDPYLSITNSSAQGIVGLATTAGKFSTSSATNDLVVKSIVGKVLLQSGNGAAGITIDTANKVGIGTSAPTEKLTIQDGKLWFNTTTADNGGIGGIMADNDYFRIFGAGTADQGALYIDTYDSANEPIIFRQVSGSPTAANTAFERMRIAANGYVGIGTTAPLAPLHVAGAARNSFNLQYYMDGGAVRDMNENRSDLDHSIIADYRVRAMAFDVNSDERIKEVIGVSNGAEDLAVLQSIKITDYSFKDKLAMGNQLQKRVIAQQVEQVYPAAVNLNSGVIPDIFKKAVVEEGWVSLATDLKVGEKVRLFNSEEDAVHEVLEVRAGAFRTAFEPKGSEVFVYGREVDDFRSVDYDAIAMLNVSATQELAKKLEQKDLELEQKDVAIAALEARLSALEKRVAGAK